MMAGREIGKGRASSLTVTASSASRRASKARRVGSESAANVRSSEGAILLTIKLTIRQPPRASQGLAAVARQPSFLIRAWAAAGLRTFAPEMK